MSYDASYSDAQHWLISLIVQSLSPHCYCSNAHSQTCQSSVVSFWQMTHSFHLTHIFSGTHWSLNMTFVTQIVFSNDFHYDLIITLLAMSSRGRDFHWRLGELLAMSITHIQYRMRDSYVGSSFAQKHMHCESSLALIKLISYHITVQFQSLYDFIQTLVTLCQWM